MYFNSRVSSNNALEWTNSTRNANPNTTNYGDALLLGNKTLKRIRTDMGIATRGIDMGRMAWIRYAPISTLLTKWF
jgi:hypothetical protein